MSTSVSDTDHVAIANVLDVPAVIDLRRLQYFVAVAEERHFGRAAARLHLTTPPLSQRIRELEEALGFALFDRTSRRVTLTPAGERLLGEARAVIAAMERFTAVAGELAAEPKTWAIGYCHGSEPAVMRTIGRLHAAEPDLVVHADGLTSLRILDGVRSGALAVGVVRGPVAADRLDAIPLARVPVDHVAVPPGHRLAANAVVAAGDLDGQPVLVVDRADAPTAHDEIEAYCVAAGARPRWITHAPVQVERVLDQVALGTGIGWLNAWQAESAARRADVAVRPLRPVSLFDDFLVVRRIDRDDPTTSALVRALTDACAQPVDAVAGPPHSSQRTSATSTPATTSRSQSTSRTPPTSMS
jgi:DNA-binding transcriptional LysR family regulator